MSQINNQYVPNLDHYHNNALEPKVDNFKVPPKILENARPQSSSSPWKTVGRVGLGIATIGLSELVHLAYRGIRSFIKNASPAPHRAPRIVNNAIKKPAAKPADDRSNNSLASAINGFSPMREEYKNAINNTLNELRRKYGEKYIPQGATIKSLLAALDKEVISSPSYKFMSEIKNAQHNIRPKDLQKIIKDVYVPMLNTTIFSQIAKDYAKQAGNLGGLKASAIIDNMLKYQPGLQNKINSFKNEADLRKFVDTLDLEHKMIEYYCKLGTAVDLACAEFGLFRTLEEGMAFLDINNNSTKGQLESYLNGNGLISPDDLGAYFKEILRPILKRNAIEKTLTQKAQEMNVPLTPRSTKILARTMLKNPELNVSTVLQAQKAGIDKAYATHAEKLAPEIRPIFRSFIEGCSFAPSAAASSNQLVDNMAERMKNWKNLDGSEELRKPLNDFFKKNIDDDLKMLEGVPGNTDSTGYRDNIYATMLEDAARNKYTINDEKITQNENAAPQALSTKLKTELPNAKDQQFMSKLINQRLWGTFFQISVTGRLPDNTSLNELPGGNAMPYSATRGVPILVQNRAKDVTPSFTVKISEDKKTAEVTATLGHKIVYEGQEPGVSGMPHYGGINFAFNIKLNLSGHEQGQSVQDVKLSQKFVPYDEMGKLESNSL